jgi:steroid delta-isomerase-like uncharacterized protein
MPEKNVCRVVREYVSAWNSHDAERLVRLFAEGGSYGEFGLGRIMLGQGEIRRYLIATFAALPDLTVTPTADPLDSGGCVYWSWLMTATHRGEFGGVLSTGKRFELRGVCFLLTQDDKIVRGADCFDVATVAGRAAPERGLYWGNGCTSADAGRGGLNPWLASLAEEDNIGYGE